MAQDKPKTLLRKRSEESLRLSKRMSELAICSRREADRWIEKGWVYVNGEPVTELGSKVTREDKIEIQQEAKNLKKSFVTILINKPVGFVSHSVDENLYKSAYRLLKNGNKDLNYPSGAPLHHHMFEGLAPIGRLDIESQGLLILTQDGTLAKKVIGENTSIEKEYLVRFEGEITPEKLERLQNGTLFIDDKKIKQAVVEQINKDQLRFILREGKKRQIRKMCEQVELSVTGLKRVRIGDIKLGKLEEGKWRYLTNQENV
ncbi:MAG: pseudouridine synthase [Bdellovibrionales bacterium]